jgi:hypothetical protein
MPWLEEMGSVNVLYALISSSWNTVQPRRRLPSISRNASWVTSKMLGIGHDRLAYRYSASRADTLSSASSPP